MIDEKKLIKKLKKNSIFEAITNVEGKNIYKIIEEQQKIDEWIPIKESLPTKNGEYLIFYKELIAELDDGKKIFDNGIVDIARFINNKWFYLFDDKELDEYIIAWKQLTKYEKE